jgi:uncharacterized membrane protein
MNEFKKDGAMTKSRLEAFSDGVIAIIITIMVLELHAPHEPHLGAMRPLIPVFLSYVLSFIYVGIYWTNHHHLLHATRQVNGKILWANLHLLFWLSLIPFATNWMGDTHFDRLPVAIYGGVMLAAAVSYSILQYVLVSFHGHDSVLSRAIGRDWKGKSSLGCYVLGIAGSLVHPMIGVGLYTLVAGIWFIPDRRISRTLAAMSEGEVKHH